MGMDAITVKPLPVGTMLLAHRVSDIVSNASRRRAYS